MISLYLKRNTVHKRCIALLLASALLFCLLPDITIAGASEPLSGETATYNFRRGAYPEDGEENTDVRLAPFTDYLGNRQWAYVADSMPEGPSRGGSNLFGAVLMPGGTQIGRAAYGAYANDWIAFKIRVPESGRYNVFLKYYGMKSNGISDIHIAPLTDEILADPHSAVNSGTKIGTVDMYNENQASYYTADVGDFTLSDTDYTSSGGECILIFQCVGRRTGATGHVIYISELTLNGVGIVSAGLNLSKSEITAGETATASVSPLLNTGGAASGYTVNYTSSAPEIAEVSSSGVVTGISDGTADITAEVTLDGETVSETVTISVTGRIKDLSEVTLTYSKTEIFIGQTVTGSVTGKLEDGNIASLDSAVISYESSAPEIAEVSSNGAVTGKAPGTAQITVSVTLRGVTVTDSVNITVTDSLPMSGVIAEYSFKYNAYAGDTGFYDARLAPYTDYTEARPWAYVADSMPEGPSRHGGNLFGASMSGNGTQIGREAYGSVSDDWIAYKIKVPESGRYKASLTYYGMKNNGIADIHIAPLTQAALNNPKSIVSPDTKIGTVDFYQDVQNLYYTAELGELSLTDEEFTASDGECLLVFQCVGRRAGATGHALYITSLTLDGVEISSVGLEVDKSEFKITKTAAASCHPLLNTGSALTEGYTVRYESSDPEIARVDEKTGLITGITPGIAQITAEMSYKYQKISETVTVTILDQTEALTEVTLTFIRTQLAVGQSVTGYVTGKLADGDDAVLRNAVIVFTSTAPEIAEVSETGYVTCKTEGEADITARVTLRGVTVEDTVTITVTPALSGEPAHAFKEYKLSGTSGDCRKTTYAATYGVWQTAGYHETLAAGALSNNNAFGMKAKLSSNQWFSIQLNIPAAGRYRFGLRYAANSGSGAVGDVYFAPYSGTSAHMWRNPEYYVNQLNFADTAGALAAGGKSESGYVSDAIAQLGEVDVEVPGEYVITFESVSAGDKQIFVSSIILDGTAQDAVLQSVSVDCAKPGLLVGQSAPLSVTAHLSDGSLITGTPPSVSLLGRSITMNAESLSPNIFSVDGTGMLTALAPGEGQVKGGASMGGVSLYSTIQISAAKAPIYSGYIETYSFKYNAYAGDTGFYDARLAPYTDYTEARPWAYVADSMPEGPSRFGGNLFGAYMSGNGTQIGREAYGSVSDDWIALKFKAPRTGRYEATVEYLGMKNNGIVDVHILPLSRVDLSDIAGSINEETKVGRFDGYNINQALYYKSVLGNVVFPVDGDYLLIFKQAGKNPDATGCAMYITSLTFDGVTPGELASITVSTESGVSEIEPGATAKIKYRAYSVGGPEIDLEDEGIVPEIINRTPEIISVDENGIVTAKKIGIAEIDVSVFLDGVSIVGSLNLYVTDFSDVLSVELNAPPFVPVRGKAQLKQSAAVASGNTIPVPQSAMSYIIVSAEPEGAATVDGNGLITGVKEGFVRIKGIANYRGRTWETPVVTVPVEIRTKTRSTIYTPEKRANVQENVKKYAWAKSEVDAVVRDADKYVDNAETLWNNVVAEGLPRFYHNGEALDPEQGLCRYCKFDISAKYGNYPYLYNALSNPWKIQCPECKRRFPSNDFGKYYKSGLDEHGVFKPSLADRSLLTNDLYPEKGEGWGVDDGFGYYPGNTYSNGVVERHNHIAYYIHEGLYGINGVQGLIPRALNSLSLAYVYTGEARYGRTGAILLDRVADFYPDFDWCMWQDYLPHTYRGKILYNTWENFLVNTFAKAYDAFYPVYDDPQVISFLRNKAERYGIENPKDSAYALRFNVEDNILREIYKACLESNLTGNFGMRQLSLTLAAVALDSSPETGEWLNWVMHPGEATTTGKPDPSSLSTGGDVMHTLINKVTRDGMGNESSPGYNTIWLESLMEIAELLHDYDKYTNWDLYNNPKFTKMFTSHIPLTLAGYYTAQIGDHSGTAGGKISVNDLFDTYVKGFARLGNPELAQILYHGNGDSVEGIHLGIMEKDPERIQQDILDVIDKYGTFSPRSDMLAGYGFAVLRDGKKYKSTGSQEVNTLRDFWMYFGTGSYHGHDDALNLGIDAYGLNMAPDLGYPEYAGTDPNRIQWVDASLSHNTVMVNGKSQTPIAYSSTPLHFDDSGRVKVMDADASQVYSYTDIYRRTVVMVKVSDEVSYGVDFFRVRGGNDHVYSFHSQSGEIDKTEGLDGLTAQNGGTYAGPDVPFGQDPKTNPNSYSKDYLLYPPGSTWLENVRRDTAPAPKFSIDFKVTDFRKLLPAHLTRDLHLRMTMLNDNPLSEVAIATGYPPKANRKWIDHLEYVLVRNTGSGNLDTLFTTVFEPYRGERYLADMSAVDMNVESGVPGDKDTARAVKVTHKNGRVDYIVYASNNTVEYLVDNKFGFKGFVGVYTLYDGEPVYSYINDGNKIGGFSGLTPAYTGQVLDFTRELSMNNSITIQPDGEIDLSKLPGRFIYVDNESSPENGAYEIVGAKETGDGIVIDIGDVSPIRAYKNKDSLASKFVYNIESGQSFRIPLPAVYDTSPVFKKIGRKTVDVGSEIRFTVEAESPAGKPLTYRLVSPPRGASFDAETRTFKWKPERNQVGDAYIAFEASDGALSAVEYAEVRVNPSTMGDTKPKEPKDPVNNDGSPGGGGGGGAGGGTPGGNGNGGGSPGGIVIPPANPDIGERFTDLAGFDWARDAINELAEKGVITGRGERFAPGENITRADFVLLLTRAFNLTGDGEGFSDVPGGAYFENALRAAKANGIIMGIGDNKFNPTGEITREDMMVIVARALEKLGVALEAAPEDVLSEFKDIGQISDYAKSAVALLVKNGLIKGTDGKINPKGRATRAEIAVLIYRILTEKVY